jgi:hypothetical protein
MGHDGQFTLNLMKRYLPFIALLVSCTSTLPKEEYGITITSHVCESDGGGCHKETKTLPFTEATR